MKKSIIGIILLAFIILGGVYYFVNISVDKNQPNKHEDTTEKKSNPYVGGYKAEVKELYDEDNKEKFYVFLNLRNDGTYTYGNDINMGSRKVGTYKVKDSTIELHDIVAYGSDVCYITKGEGVKDRTLKIINKNTLEIEDDGRVLKFVYDSNMVESAFEKSWYVTNPIDGQAPEISDVDEVWTDCTEQ